MNQTRIRHERLAGRPTSSLFLCSWLSSVLARLSWLCSSRDLDWDVLSLTRALWMLSSTCGQRTGPRTLKVSVRRRSLSPPRFQTCLWASSRVCFSCRDRTLHSRVFSSSCCWRPRTLPSFEVRVWDSSLFSTFTSSSFLPSTNKTPGRYERPFILSTMEAYRHLFHWKWNKTNLFWKIK